MTQAKLRQLTRRWVPWWRDRLGLRDWVIDIEFTVTDDAHIAECAPNYSERRATVKLAPAARWATYTETEIEETFVHELLHIHLGALGVGLDKYERGKLSKGVLAEQVINALATCLVACRRGTR